MLSSFELKKILVRSTNWIGDAVMTLPAVAAVRAAFPQAHVSILAKPWVAEIFRICPDADEIVLFESPGAHDGVAGKFRLAGELKRRGFDAAILLQNAIEAAIIAGLAGIPIRAGYDSDCRGVLLTHPVRRTPEVRKVHQIEYYLAMLAGLGIPPAGKEARLKPGEEYHRISESLLKRLGMDGSELLVGIAPGAAYGPAKRWPAERFAEVADRLSADPGCRVLLFGSEGDRQSVEAVQKSAGCGPVSLAGKTGLREAIALIARCRLFISNDSGLMHVAGALGVPTVAIFGSTNPAATSPPGARSIVIWKGVPCSPCLKQECPTDFRCMNEVTADEVYEKARKLIKDCPSINR